MINYQDFIYNGERITFSFDKDVYVNATKMSAVFNKRPVDWLRLDATEAFLSTLSNVRQMHISRLVITKQGSSVVGGGTWMHKDVAIEFARWLSPMFAIWCNDRILELMTTGHTSIPVPSADVIPVTDEIKKNDTITTVAMREVDKEYTFADVGRLITWNGKAIRKRLLMAWMHEHKLLCVKDGCEYYPTELALSLGLMTVIDHCKRGEQQKRLKPRVRITMDGCNYLINVLQHGLRGVIKV